MFNFPKRVRLRTQHEFSAVFRSPQRVSENGFSAVYSRNEVGFARLGLSIAKRHIKHSHDRNRIKRLIREAFRHEKDNFAGFDIVVMVKYPLAERENTELSGCIKRLLQKLERQLKQPSVA